MDKKFGFGIIGCGIISEVHLKAINDIENARLIGVSAGTIEEAENFAKTHDTYAFESTEKLLECEEIDIVCICTPSGLHLKLAMEAAKHKKHFIIEKPMALTIEDCEKVIKAANENKVYGTVISQLRFSEDVQNIKNALSNNELGRMVLANLHMKYFRSQEYYDKGNWRGTWSMDGGGALMNQGIHGVDILLYLMGKIKSISGFSKTITHNIEVEDNAVASVVFENGAIGSIIASTSVNPGESRKIEIHGERGTIILEENNIVKWIVDGTEKEFESKKTNYNGANSNKLNCFLGHKTQINDFINSVIEGKTPFISLEEGAETVKIITAVYKSSKEGKIINL